MRVASPSIKATLMGSAVVAVIVLVILQALRIPSYIGLPVFAVILLVGCFLLAGFISKPISEAAALAEAIRSGQLSKRVRIAGLQEARRLGRSLNEMAASLADFNKQILQGVNVLTDSVGQIAGTSSELLTGTSRTASAVTETTAIVNEMESTAKVVNETARRVAEHSEQSDSIANAGTKATGDTLEKMTLIREKMEIVSTAVVKLNENTKYVEGILASVQDLADQSNLLAVNASIEAARAGENGKGFAVVAHEIKSLADQSREATGRVAKSLREIRESVSSVVAATEEGGKAVLGGVEQSEAAGGAIENLARSITEFSQAAGVIFSSSGQQFSRVERVASAMRNVEQATNSSVAGTTQLENEAKRLEELAESLKSLLNRHNN